MTTCDKHSFTPGSLNPPQLRHPRLFQLHAPHGVLIHPAAEQLQVSSIEWVLAFGLTPSAAQIERLKACRIGQLVGFIFPHAKDRLLLQLLADWITLFFCLDDVIEQIEDVEQLQQKFRRWLLVLWGGQNPCWLDPFEQSFADLRRRLLECGRRNVFDGLAARIDALFGAFTQEACYRITQTLPTLEDYLTMREETIGIATGFPFGETLEQVERPPCGPQHLALQTLEGLACRIVGVSNDILTVEGELKRGEVNNAVIIVMRRGDLDLEAAMSEIIALHNAMMVEFLGRLDQALDQFGADPQFCCHLEMLYAFVVGHGRWAAQTGRYATTATPAEPVVH